MTQLSIAVEGAAGLTWPVWKQLVAGIDELGFSALYLSDHFTTPAPIYTDSLEMLVALGYLAAHSQHVHFGPLVAPLSFRDPVLLARQAIALDTWSGGRLVLGVGAGWMEREHAMFGYHLGDVRTRLDRLAEGLAVLTLLLRSAEPVSYAGQFYRLQEAVLQPRPAPAGRPPLLVGASGPRRALPLVARYADIWNGQRLLPAAYQTRAARLDELLIQAGRPPGTVKRTYNTLLLCGRNPAELEQRVASWRRAPDLAHLPLDTLLSVIRTLFPTAIIGAPASVVEQIQRYQAAGVEELTIQWFGLPDMEGLHLLAEEVRPYV